MAKKILITGASSGIGKATALYFATQGWEVIATMRNPQNAGELADNDRITVLQLDVTNQAEIDAVVKDATASGKVDVVLNNAGFGSVGPLEGTSTEQLQQIINTNLIGVIQLTKAFLPHFRKNKGGVFIAISSIGGLVSYPFFSLYHATKWAIEGWTESMAFELKPLGIKIKTVQPGATKSEFVGRSLVMPEHEAYDKFFDGFKSLFFSDEVINSMDEPESVAKVVYEAATDGKDQLRYLVGPAVVAEFNKRLTLGAEEFHNQTAKIFLS